MHARFEQKRKGADFLGSPFNLLAFYDSWLRGLQPPQMLVLPFRMELNRVTAPPAWTVGDSGLLTVGRRARNKAHFLGDFLITEGSRGSLTR